jgi:hypothetical protein
MTPRVVNSWPGREGFLARGEGGRSMLQDIFGGLDSFTDRAKLFSWLFGAPSGYLAWRRTDTPKNDIDRNVVIAALREGRFGARYKVMLTRALDALDEELSWAERADGGPPRAFATAWSFGLLNLSLTLALAYPTLGLLINWGLFNDGALGGDQMIPEADGRLRVAVFSGISMLAGLRLVPRLFKIGASNLLEFVSPIFAVAAVAAIVFSGAFAGAGALTVAFAGAVAFAGVGAGAVGAAIMFAVVFAIVGASASAFATAAAATIAIVGTLVLVSERLNLRATVVTIWAVLGVVSVSLIARNGGGSAQYSGTILFISALPLINGLADFASAGLTRHLLRRSLDTSGRWEAALDLIGGVAIYLALGCVIIAFIAWTPLPGQTYLANLPRIFQDLGDPAFRGAYWWLLVMLALTLLPTVLHLHLFLMTLFRHIPARLRHWLANEFEQAAEIDSNARGRDAVFMLSALNAFALVAPLWLMVELWLSAAPYAIDGSIAIFRCFALAIGAIA